MRPPQPEFPAAWRSSAAFCVAVLWRNREVGAILSSRSWEDCIVNTSGFDFRYGQVYRWACDYSVPGDEQDFVAQNQPTGSHAPLRKTRREHHDTIFAGSD